MRSKFWCVWNEGGRHIPTFKHRTLANARLEAERLARRNPEGEFTILESTESVRKADVQREDHSYGSGGEAYGSKG